MSSEDNYTYCRDSHVEREEMWGEKRKKRWIVLKRNKKVTALNVTLGYQEKAFQSQIGGSCCFHSLQFYLISTVFFSFTQMLLVTHWSASLTLQPIRVCMCKLIIVVRDWVRVFRLSLPSGTAAGYAIILEYFGRRKVGESKQNLKWLFSRCFNSLFVVKLFCPSNECLLFSFHFTVLSSKFH